MIATENWVGSKYQPKLTAGTGITIVNNVISADGGGSGGSIPSNMVTTNTSQTITGYKKFTNLIDLNKVSIASLKDKIHIVNYNETDRYVDIDYSGRITLTGYASNIDGVLELPRTGTTSSPKTIAVTSDIPTTTSALTNDSGFITNAALANKQDVISDLATIRSGAEAGATAVQPAALSEYAKTSELATVATSGSYNDLTNKPTITNVSGVNDGTNWTSLTIGSDTYGLGGGGSGGSSYTFTNGLTETNGTVSLNLNDTLERVSVNYNHANELIIKNGWDSGKSAIFKLRSQDGSALVIQPEYSQYSDIGLYIKNSDAIYWTSNNKIDLGKSSSKFKTIYATNLSDGTTTKTMTEVLAGGGGGGSTTYMHVLKLSRNDNYTFDAWSTVYTKSETPFDKDTLTAWFTSKGLTYLPASGSGKSGSSYKYLIRNIKIKSGNLQFETMDLNGSIESYLVSLVEDTVVAVD